MLYLKQATAGQEILLGPFVDDADGKTAETSLTIANTDIKIWKEGATAEASKSSGGATHIASGRYYAVLDATDTDTIGKLEINVAVAGALPVMRQYHVLHANVYDWMFGSAAPNTVAPLDAAGVRGAVGLGSANLDTQLADIPTAAGIADAVWDENLLTHTTSFTAGGYMSVMHGDTTNSLPTLITARTKLAADYFDPATDTVTVGTNNDKTGYSLAADQAVNVTKVGGVAVSGVDDFKADVSNLPTVTAFEARTKPAADYFDHTTDTVSADAVSLSGVALTNVHGINFERLYSTALSLGASQLGSWDQVQAKISAVEDDTANSLPTLITARTKLAADYFDHTTDQIIVGTNNDKTGYSITQSFPSNFAALGINASGHIERVTLVDTTTANTDMRGTDSAYTGTPPTAASIADAVWDEAQTDHNGAGTFGAYLDASVSGVSTGGVSAADIADAVWDEVLSGHVDAGSAGAELAATYSGTPPTAESISTQVASDLASAHGSGSWTTATGFATPTNVTDAQAAILDHGDLTWASQASVDALAGDGDTIDGHTTIGALRLMLSAATGKLSGAATTTIDIRAADDSKTRITATVDADGNRTAVTLDDA